MTRVVGFLLAGAACSGQTAPTPLNETAVLSASEIHYSESGGFAGRLEEVTIRASGGRISIEYRPPDGPSRTMTGAIPDQRYVELWRQLEGIGIWTAASPRKSSGADLVEHALRVRLGEQAHAVRWDTLNVNTMAEIAAVGQQLLQIARTAPVDR